MDNYIQMQKAAQKRFLTYDAERYRNKFGVFVTEDQIKTLFLGQQALISRSSGEIEINGRPATFEEAMCLYDWLCDGREGATASGEYSPVSSLPGVLVGGSGLTIHTEALAELVSEKPDKFGMICSVMGGKPQKMGDISYEIPLFSDLRVLLKFYFADDDFPASLLLMWDRNILQYIRYETVYYLAHCLLRQLEQELRP